MHTMINCREWLCVNQKPWSKKCVICPYDFGSRSAHCEESYEKIPAPDNTMKKQFDHKSCRYSKMYRTSDCHLFIFDKLCKLWWFSVQLCHKTYINWIINWNIERHVLQDENNQRKNNEIHVCYCNVNHHLEAWYTTEDKIHRKKKRK